MGSMPDAWREWQAPPYNATEDRKIGWLNEACQEGNSWQQGQRGFDDWSKALDIFAGTYSDKNALQYRSQFTGNRLKTNIRVTIAGLSAIRPWSGYTAGDAFKKEALMMNLTTRSLYLANHWDLSIKEALWWASVTGGGFVRPVFRRAMAGQGHGKIEFDTCGWPNVLPVQLPSNGDLNRAYAVTYLDEKPIWEAHGMFPDFQDRLKPTSSKYWYSNQIRKASQANAERRFWTNPFKKREQSDSAKLLIPIRYTRINDLAINTTGKTIFMGEPGASWSYEVPSVGMDIPTGVDRDGHAQFRKAEINDCRLYPYGRMMIGSENCVMYDGTDFNWHGELDLILFSLERYPWEPMGFSSIHDGWGFQKAIDGLDRGNLDKANADMDRPLAYNMNAVGKREANQVDLMQPRQRIAFDGDAVDKPFTQIAPDDVYKISPESLALKDKLEQGMDYTLQTRDVVELAKARALGKGIDQLEALISASGPLVKEMSHGMEKPICQVANQVKYLVLQYMDTSQLIPFITESGAARVFDYNPSELTPSHLPGERTVDANNQPVGSPTSRINRARWFARNLPFVCTPHSIHEIHQIQHILMKMQMKQRGAPIPWADIMEAASFEDVKRPTGSTIQERFFSETEEQIEFQMRLAKAAQGLGIDIGQLMGAGGAGKKPEGRPPSGKEAPQQQVKGDGRPVISESG
jgi:hypothetical protein